MGKYTSEHIKRILWKIINEPPKSEIFSKTPEEAQRTYEQLTEPETLKLLTNFCNLLEEVRESEE